MLNKEDKYHIDTIGWKDGVAFLDGSFEVEENIHIDRTPESGSDELEYIWLLLRQAFSFVNSGVNHFPLQENPMRFGIASV